MTIRRRTEPQNSKVEFRSDAVWIEGQPHIVLCASLFYFRIPREEWQNRLELVKAAGYNCIETYFPWNYHELEEGNWEFEGEKEVTAFLSLAASLGLWVIARPGPYICSEWDMGALPAYLLDKEGIVLRDYNEVYLRYVERWYDRIIPMIAKYQIGKQGTVIAVQIENELDFYDCKQVELYIATLQSFAVKGGIEVPIFACAGQCDINRAGGLVEGILPTINLYPEVRERELETRIRHYVETFRENDLPVCITETGSKHVILRRELMSGAKLIAPYNQVCGTDFGFTTAVNNWGKPLSYLSHDYNLGGMIDPRGELNDEYNEALLLTGLLHSLEEEIALGWSEEERKLHIWGEGKLSHSIRQILCLPGGGKLIGIANIDDTPGEIRFTYRGKSRPAYTGLTIPPYRCPILPFEIPLITLGIEEPGRLAYSTAEIGDIRTEDGITQVMFYTEEAAEIAFELQDTVKIEVQGIDILMEKDLTVFTYTSEKSGTAQIEFADGKQLLLYAVSREEAINRLKANRLSANGLSASRLSANQLSSNSLLSVNLSFDCMEHSTATKALETLTNSLQQLTYRKHTFAGMGSELGTGEVHTDDYCKAMEELKHYRGYGWYEGKVKGNIERVCQERSCEERDCEERNSKERTSKKGDCEDGVCKESDCEESDFGERENKKISCKETDILGYLVYNGMDIVHLYRNGVYLSTILGDATHQFIPEPEGCQEDELRLGVRCEIWGHSNFSDSRIPAMDIRSKKGIRGLAVIHKIEEISENWCYHKDVKPGSSCTRLSDQDQYRPRITFGSYNNPEQPQYGVYKKVIRPAMEDSDALVLSLSGLKSYARVYVDGELLKELQPMDCSVSLDAFSHNGEFELSIYYEQKTIQESHSLRILLYEGYRMKEISCRGADERQLVSYIEATPAISSYESQPIHLSHTKLKSGEMALFSTGFQLSEPLSKGLRFKVSGRDVKLLLILNGKMMGRLWLPSEGVRPLFKGGDETLLNLPKSYFRTENQLELLVEAMLGEPEITEVIFE